MRSAIGSVPPEVPEEVDRVAASVVDSVVKVRRVLGAGHLEKHYKTALRIELEPRGHRVRPEAPFVLTYEGHVVGRGYADFVVDDVLVVEAKAVEHLHAAHFAQALSYARALRTPMALLVNFNAVPLRTGIKRIVPPP